MNDMVGSAGTHHDWGTVKVALAWVMTLIGVITLSQWVLVATLIFSMFQIYKVILEIKKLRRDADDHKKRSL